jgi:hypothetical protein
VGGLVVQVSAGSAHTCALLDTGATPPAGYVRIGSFRQEVNDPQGGRGGGGTILVHVYVKQ